MLALVEPPGCRKQDIPIPQKLARQGVKDMIRISDARMSDTAFGTIILHVPPNSGNWVLLLKQYRKD